MLQRNLRLLEIQGSRVHAIPQPGRSGAIVEDVPDVSVTFRATYFRAFHSERAVRAVDHVFFRDWFEEARPACSRFKFRVGRKQSSLTADAAIDSMLVVIPVLS